MTTMTTAPVTTPLVEICMKHGMNPAHRAEFFAFVLHGRRPSAEVQNRLKYVDNYKAALAEAKACLPATPFVSVSRFTSLPLESLQ